MESVCGMPEKGGTRGRGQSCDKEFKCRKDPRLKGAGREGQQPAARSEHSDPGESRRQAGHTDRGRDYWHSDTATASLKGSRQRNKLY